MSGPVPPRRRIRNFLLEPLLQIRLGLYCVLLTVVFAGTTVMLFHFSISGLFDVILELTDVRDMVAPMIDTAMKRVFRLLTAITLIYMAVTLAVSIIYTHRLVGPSYAFRRHLKLLMNGQFSARTQLRKGDAFQEVASDLNQLSEMLERNVGGKRQEG